jgi:hypothetical protein
MLSADCSKEGDCRMNIPFLSKPKPRCSHQTKNGKQCNATPQKAKDFCFFHDPERAEERTAARRQGGVTSTRRGPLSLELAAMPLEQSADVGRFLGQLVIQICQGNVEVRQGTGIAFITTCMMHAFDRARRDAEDAVLGPLRGKPPNQMLAALLDPNSASAASSFFQSWQMNANDDFKRPSDATLPEAFRSGNRHRNAPEPEVAGETDDNQPGVPHSRLGVSGNSSVQVPLDKAVSSSHELETGNSKPETAIQTLLEKGGTPSEPEPEPAPHAITAGDSCVPQVAKPATLTLTPVVDGDHARDSERSATDFDEKAYREEGDRLRNQQAEIIARIESKQSEGSDSDGPTFGKERESAGLQAMAEVRRAKEEERRAREIEERRELQKYQMERYGCCSPDLDFPAFKQYESKDAGIGQAGFVDLARKKLDAQDLEFKKEIACALAPTTMKSSIITEHGVKAAPPDPSQKAAKRGAPAPVPSPPRNRDDEPSPVPGLQNRHLNYMKYAGMPAWALKQMGIVFARRWR